MSDTSVFDTLVCAKKLKSAGFTEEQAEVQAEIFAGIIDEKLATKQDIHDLRRDMKELETSLKRDMKELEISLKRDMKELEISLKRDTKELETSLKRDVKELEISLKRDMGELKTHMIIRLGAIQAAGIAIVAALVKLL